MTNTSRVEKKLFADEHYLGRPADENDLIIRRRINLLHQVPGFLGKQYDCIEIGCGTGVTINRVSKEFRSCLGIDVYDYSGAFETERKKSQALNTSFQQIDLEKEMPEGRFDRIISFEVIEHFPNEDTVAAYSQLLKEGGMAALSVPNKWWIFETHGARLSLLPWNRVPFFSWLPRPLHERWAHARIYTKSRIQKLLEAHGLQVKYISYITAPLDVLPKGRIKTFLQKTLFRGDETRIPFLSTSIFIVAVKPGRA